MKHLTALLHKLPALTEDQSWGAGVSGGLDSMVMAEALRLSHLPFRVLHFNHQWRGEESYQDAALVRQWCHDHRIACSTATWRKPVHTEAAARRARMVFFHKQCKRYSLAGVILAHHQDDLAETALLQILRGAGAAGLDSLHADRMVDGLRLLRPFLHVRRMDLLRIARSSGLSWREDSSNCEPTHLRNRIRHRLLPYLNKLSGRDVTPLLARTADILSLENDYWDQQLPHPAPEKLSVRLLQTLHPAHQRRLIRHWLLTHAPASPSFEEIESIRGLLQIASPARVNMQKNHYCRRRAGFLFLCAP
ncbi:MAG: tRNA lysidine(34) synthetase TilS [Candidatus Methylacidiphilales bacterium]